MTAAVPFNVQVGLHKDEQTPYLPFGTRTLRLSVTNNTGQAQKMWIRPERVAEDVFPPEALVYGYGDEDQDLQVHWAGGDEVGACVKTDEKSPFRDRDLRVWEVIPVNVEVGETRSVFLNVTHRAGPLKPRTLTLHAYTKENDDLKGLDSTLKLNLTVPVSNGSPVVDPVRGVWNSEGTHLTFKGTQLPDYVSRWWGSDDITYQPARDLPGRLAMAFKDDMLTLTVDPDREPTLLATVKDRDWEETQTVPQLHDLRPIIPELFHFCGDRYYVVRLWFLWLDKRIGPKHEVPDAERVDVLFDLIEKRVRYMGTDFHYKETWGRLRPGEACGEIDMGLSIHNLDHFVLKTLDAGAFNNLRKLFTRSEEPNPARVIAGELCETTSWQTGPQAHVPMLKNIILFQNVTSPDVRGT